MILYFLIHGGPFIVLKDGTVMLLVHSATDNSITTSNFCLFLRYWLTNKINIKRPSTGLLMYTMATRFCDEIYLYGFWPFPKDGNGNPVKYHYYDELRYRYFSKAGPHRMPLEFKTLKRLHSKGALKLTTSKCTYPWRAAYELKWRLRDQTKMCANRPVRLLIGLL